MEPNDYRFGMRQEHNTKGEMRMKTKLILAILLICMAGLLFGSEIPADMDEMQRRTQELKALSERFKADKGFEGVIETNTEVMKLSHFRGNFKDIDMSGVSDTLAFRQVCNRIISKLLVPRKTSLMQGRYQLAPLAFGLNTSKE